MAGCQVAPYVEVELALHINTFTTAAHHKWEIQTKLFTDPLKEI